jgi:hypothetical protein
MHVLVFLVLDLVFISSPEHFPPDIQVASIASSPHTAMSDLLLVMVMAPRRFFSSVPRPEIPCWRCRVMQSTPSRASHRLRVSPAGSIAGDFQITRPISLDVSSFTSLLFFKILPDLVDNPSRLYHP